MLYIGLDTGVHTGFAVWDSELKRITELATMKIHEAMLRVKDLSISDDIVVFFEDARLRTWFGRTGQERLMGAGSVRRDCSIWEDFLTDLGIEFHPVAPKNNTTKISADFFRKLSGYKGRTSTHARDAAMLVIHKKQPNSLTHQL